jgi:hypothetical protein
LLNLSFSGKSVRYITSDEKTTDEVAEILGKAIGKPDLKWLNFTDEINLEGMMQSGLPEDVAKNYTEMGAAMRSGEMASEYMKSRTGAFGKYSFESFAPVFAAAYEQA